MLYLQINPLVYFVFIIYSVLFLFKTKNRNEFLIILIIFTFIQEQTAWDIGIREIISKPIVVKPSDFVLVFLSFYIIIALVNNYDKLRLIKQNRMILFFIMFLIFNTLFGYFKYGYAAIAEFRSKFSFIIVFMYVVTNVKKHETIILLERISSYLIPLILLLPLSLLLNKNFTFSVENRILSAFFYESITLGFLGGYFCKKYFDYKNKMFFYSFPIYIVSSLYLSHRSVWAMIIIIISLLFLTREINFKYAFQMGVLLLISYILTIKNNLGFFNERLLAFSNIEADPTGNWRLLVWNSIIRGATYFGKGLGGRFEIWTDELGYVQYGTHNMYMTLLYYMGYIGLVIFLLFLSSLFIKLFIYFINTKNDLNNGIVHLGLISIVGSMIYMFAYETDIVSWIYVAFAFINTTQVKNKKDELS